MACGPIDFIRDPAACGADMIQSTISSGIDGLATYVMEAYGKTIASLGTVWVHIGTPNLTGSGDVSPIDAGSSALNSGGIETVLGYVTWIALAVAVLSLFILGAMIATRMRAGEGVAAVGKIGLILAAVVLISGAGSLVSGLLAAGPDTDDCRRYSDSVWSCPAGATLFLQSGLWWYMGAAAVLSVLVGATRMVWEQRAEPGRETVKSLLTLVVVAGAGVTTVGLLVAAADSFSVWLLNASLGCEVNTPGSSCFGENMLVLLALTTTTPAAGLGSLLIIILGLIAVLAAVFQIVLMVARGGMLVILAGILPLSASFTNTEMGKTWFRKCIAWLVAFILYKPAAAIVYAAAFELTGTDVDVFNDDGTGLLAVLTGLMLMIIALFAMPALMRFVTPMVGAMASGAAGGALAAGALAALPTGAAAIGRLSSGAGRSSSGATTSSDSNSSDSAPSGNTGGGDGAAANPGGAATNGAPAQQGASASQGASTTASAGGAGAASAGGGAAAGGAAAAGTAAGPVGMAAGAALDAAKAAGQAAAGAARQIGQDATGEGGGPDGSR